MPASNSGGARTSCSTPKRRSRPPSRRCRGSRRRTPDLEFTFQCLPHRHAYYDSCGIDFRAIGLRGLAPRFNGIGASGGAAVPTRSRRRASSMSAAALAPGLRSSGNTAWRICSGTTAPGSIVPGCSSPQASSARQTSVSGSRLNAHSISRSASKWRTSWSPSARRVSSRTWPPSPTSCSSPRGYRDRAAFITSTSNGPATGLSSFGRGTMSLPTPFASHSGSSPT